MDATLDGVPPSTVFDALLWHRTLFAQSALGVTLVDGQRRLVDATTPSAAFWDAVATRCSGDP